MQVIHTRLDVCCDAMTRCSSACATCVVERLSLKLRYPGIFIANERYKPNREAQASVVDIHSRALKNAIKQTHIGTYTL